MDIVKSPTIMVCATKNSLDIKDLKKFLERIKHKYFVKNLKCSCCGNDVQVPLVVTDKDFIIIGHYISVIERFLDHHPEMEHEIVLDFIEEMSSDFKDFYREGE